MAAAPVLRRYPPGQQQAPASTDPTPAPGPAMALARKAVSSSVAKAASTPPSTPAAASNTCPTCGGPENVQLLEHELRSLTEKYLTTANQLRELQEQNRRPTTSSHDARPEGAPEATASDATLRPTGGLARFASFRLGAGGMLSSVASQGTGTSPPIPDLVDTLQKELAKESAARVEAERRVTVTNAELEELSAQLFEEANQMVAVERKTNARLEERVAVLEKRDKDKSRRLEQIEQAHTRIERVRTLLDKG